MYKVVYNGSPGKYHLSGVALRLLRDRGFEGVVLPRHHPELVRVVEELGGAANGSHGVALQIAEVQGPYLFHVDDSGEEEVLEPGDLPWVDPTVMTKDCLYKGPLTT